MLVLNRSAIVVKPKEPFLDWLHAVDPSSRDLAFLELVREPSICLIPECDTDDDVADVLHELCEEIFGEQLAGWYADISTWPRNRSFDVFCHWFDNQHHSNWLISAKNRSPSCENVICLTTRRSRDLVLANHSPL
jgi:hypothetical protein